MEVTLDGIVTDVIFWHDFNAFGCTSVTVSQMVSSPATGGQYLEARR
jgi:hypothetical protein